MVGFRHAKTSESSAGFRCREGQLDETRNYYYSPGWQVLEERLDDSTSAERQFIWGLRYIDDLVLWPATQKLIHVV